MDGDYECRKLDEALELKKTQIIEAVREENIYTLRTLLDSPKLYNIRDESGYTLLQIAVLRNREKGIFDYLLSLEDYPFDAVNDQGETPLMTVLSAKLSSSNGKDFAVRLIEKGADIHRIGHNGKSFLHYAFGKQYLDVVILLVKKGLDLNRQDNEGVTPLLACCKRTPFWLQCLLEGVTMLLSYGADPTIRDRKGRTAFDFVLCKRSAFRGKAIVAENLFYYLFDDYTEYDIDFEMLLRAAVVDSPIFEQVLKYIRKVFVNDDSIEDVRCTLFVIKPKYLQVFIEKFDRFVIKILKKSLKPLTPSFTVGAISAENFYILGQSKLQSEFVEWLCEIDTCGFIQHCINFGMPEDSLTGLICFLLSYGMTVRTEDLHVVYRKFGYCELLKILLHMDLRFSDYTWDVMPRLLYDFNTDDALKLIKEPLTLTITDLKQILSYFVIPKAKQISFNKWKDQDIIKKIQNQPEVPLLIEMARNVFRRYFVQKLNITTARQFYTQLNSLPISNHYKKIIRLETKLYY